MSWQLHSHNMPPGHAKEARLAEYTAGKHSKAQWQEAKKFKSSSGA
jgi:hypothetical protein